MFKYIIPLLFIPSFANANEISLIKPIYGYHYQDRNFNGKDWNENYMDSLGLGYRHESGLGAYAIYVNENSVNQKAWYIHSEYMPKVTEWLSVGFAGGVRNGYPKKSEGRSSSDFIPSGAFQIEPCFNGHCLLMQVTHEVSVINYKYGF
jgi:hypothetical protein